MVGEDYGIKPDVSPTQGLPFKLEREMFTVLISEKKRRNAQEDMDREFAKKFDSRLQRRIQQREHKASKNREKQ